MAYKAVSLIDAKHAENTTTTQYTATNVRAVIQQFTATNNSGTAATLTVHIVPSGGSADTTNVILDARPIADGEAYTCPELAGHVLENGDYIATVASAGSAIVIKASGLEISG